MLLMLISLFLDYCSQLTITDVNVLKRLHRGRRLWETGKTLFGVVWAFERHWSNYKRLNSRSTIQLQLRTSAKERLPFVPFGDRRSPSVARTFWYTHFLGLVLVLGSGKIFMMGIIVHRSLNKIWKSILDRSSFKERWLQRISVMQRLDV